MKAKALVSVLPLYQLYNFMNKQFYIENMHNNLHITLCLR